PIREVLHGRNSQNDAASDTRRGPPNLLVKGGPLKLIAQAEKTPKIESGALRAFRCARIAAENKARDVVVLGMREITPLYDYFVIATGASRKQIHTIAEEIDAHMTGEGEIRMGIEGYASCKWVVQDYGDIVVHLFDPEMRDYYSLQDL